MLQLVKDGSEMHKGGTTAVPRSRIDVLTTWRNVECSHSKLQHQHFAIYLQNTDDNVNLYCLHIRRQLDDFRQPHLNMK